MANIFDSMTALLAGIPDYVWAPIATLGAAAFAVLGVKWSLSHQAAASRRQREFELRRDLLLSLAEKAAIPSQMLGRITYENASIAEVGQMLLPASGDFSKAACVAGLATMTKAHDAGRCFVQVWLETLKERIRYDSVSGRFKQQQSKLEGLRGELVAELEGLKDKPQMHLYVDSLIEQKKELEGALPPLFERQVQAHLRLRQKADEGALAFDRSLQELQLAIRDELDSASHKESGVKIDRERYQKISSAASKAREELQERFFAWLSNYRAQVNAGEDPLKIPN